MRLSTRTFPANAMAAFVTLFHASSCGVLPPYAPPAERDAFRAERHAVRVLGAGANCEDGRVVCARGRVQDYCEGVECEVTDRAWNDACG